MKAKQVLHQYAQEIRDFRGVNLRGQSFKGKNLSEADFSGSDLRGTKFNDANLTKVNFTQAKTGLQTHSIIIVVLGLYLISVLCGLCVAVFVWFTSGYFVDDEVTKYFGGVGFFLIAVVWSIMVIRKGLVVGMVSGVMAGAVCGAIISIFDSSGVLSEVLFASLVVGGLIAVVRPELVA